MLPVKKTKKTNDGKKKKKKMTRYIMINILNWIHVHDYRGRITFLRATTGTNLIVDALPTIKQSFVHFYPEQLEI
jgi:hypothetical protein